MATWRVRGQEKVAKIVNSLGFFSFGCRRLRDVRSRDATNINVNQKTLCEDAYGREHVSRGPNGENRNKLTTDAMARLMMEIVTGKAANPARTAAMMELMKREYARQS